MYLPADKQKCNKNILIIIMFIQKVWNRRKNHSVRLESTFSLLSTSTNRFRSFFVFSYFVFFCPCSACSLSSVAAFQFLHFPVTPLRPVVSQRGGGAAVCFWRLRLSVAKATRPFGWIFLCPFFSYRLLPSSLVHLSVRRLPASRVESPTGVSRPFWLVFQSSRSRFSCVLCLLFSNLLFSCCFLFCHITG